MSVKTSYAVQKIIERAVKAAKDAGLEVGGVEVLPDGTVRATDLGRRVAALLEPAR